MKKNFKVVRIQVIGGAASIVASNLGESEAWAYATSLEEKQAGQGADRVVWYAVTESEDWRYMATAYYNMRRQNQPHF